MMIKRIGWLAVVLGVILGGVAAAQQQPHPILDMLAAKVIDKYSQSTCEQLWEARGKPKSAQEQEMVTFLRGDAQMRTEFLNKIAAPVANKMFECGMIP
jgi:hypothetical protein